MKEVDVLRVLRTPVVQALQDWFSLTYKVGSGIFDEYVRPITFETNHCDYCKKIRATPDGIIRCRKSDFCLIQQCKRTGRVLWRLCDNGLLDIGAPIRVGGRTVAYLLAGQLRGVVGRCHTDGDLKQIQEVAYECGVRGHETRALTKSLTKAFGRIKPKTEEGLQDIHQAVSQFGGLLSWVATKTMQWTPQNNALGEYLAKAVHAETVDELLDLSVQWFPRIIGAKDCSIFLVGTDVDLGERLILRKTSYLPLKPMEGTGSYRRGQGLTGWVWKTGRSLRVRNGRDKAELAAIDLHDPPKRSGHLKDCEELRESLCVPFFDRRGNVKGVVRTPRKTGGFTLDDEISLSTLAGHLYSLIQHIESREREADIKKALHAALKMQQCVDGGEVWGALLGAAAAFLGPNDKAFLFNEVDLAARRITIRMVQGNLGSQRLVGRDYPLAGTTAAEVAKTRSFVLIHDLKKARESKRYLPAVRGAKSIVVAPICADRSQLLGVLGVGAAKRYAFSDDDGRLLCQLCDCAAEAYRHVLDRRKASEYERIRLISNLLIGLRHDLGQPMSVLDATLRDKWPEQEDIFLLSGFVQSGLAGYQFIPAASRHDQVVGLEESLRERVKKHMQEGPFPLRPLLERCVRVLDVTRVDTPRCRISCPEDCQLRGDYQLLMLAMYNLIKNAREHSSRRTSGERIGVTVRQDARATSIAVTDGNAPIAPEIGPTLFEFKSLSPESLSARVGLPLARLFIEAHPGPSGKGHGRLLYERRGNRNRFAITIGRRPRTEWHDETRIAGRLAQERKGKT